MTLRPVALFIALFSLPRRVMPAFDRHVTLPVEELDKPSVQKLKGRTRRLRGSEATIEFNPWRLAHAVKKADCSRWQTAPFLCFRTAGFLLENACLFDWQADNLRLRQGAAKELADFSATSLAGRVAQGMALLFLEGKGFAYVGRFESEWQKRAAAQNKPRPAGKQKAPDFIAANTQNDWVLAESKGRFASPGARSKIKGMLRDGLSQLDGWDKFISPQPIKSYAIGTILREAGDPSRKPSMISFVDPEPEPPSNPVEFPADAVRRTNYASWLALMDFEDASVHLLAGSGETKERPIQVLTLSGRKYAVRVTSVSPLIPDAFIGDLSDEDQIWYRLPPGWARNGLCFEVIGLDLSVLRTISATLTSPTHPGLMELQPDQPSELQAEAEGEAFYGSVFSDGSLLGELRLSGQGPGYPSFKWETVEL